MNIVPYGRKQWLYLGLRFCILLAAAPGWFTGVGWSDHWSFWKQRIPAIMITDTALFRYPWYHTSGDTPDKVDCERTARVVSGIARVIIELAG